MKKTTHDAAFLPRYPFMLIIYMRTRTLKGLPITRKHNSHPLNYYPSVRCEICFCVPPLLTHLNPSRRARHERRGLKRGEAAPGRSQKNVTPKATPCLRRTASQRGRRDPVKRNCGGQLAARCAHRRSCQSAGFDS